ncbi:hypothetical protein Hamer_G027956 [Homarus americanus]|uniref:Uncharacterized protein n=1 Tax=Homarus americanus TaxID=6706 RepID=A0A8J5THI8_HOMAM|nr:hypothetical protein Hamer_G027956 [Homarus americanus]
MSDENLNLAIVPDPRVKTWNLYVFRCRPEQPRPREGDCPVTSYDKVGNNTYLHIKSRFLPNSVYYFIVHDIYVANDINQLADPCEWLLGKLSDGRSSVKVVLLLSPWVTRLLQALVDGKPPPVMESDPEETRFHTNLLTAALRRLLAQDLTRDYHRVFVVSLGETVSEVKTDLNLLVESKRYRLPLHWQQLAASILDSKHAQPHHLC